MTTYHFGLIGYPITHSLSPFIHKHFLKDTGLDGEYSIIEINPDGNFSDSILRIREMRLNGFNITVPYKQKIIEYLDEVDVSAKDIGAVNTVLCQDNKLIGYNTDGKGYVRSLVNKFPNLQDRKNISILVLGAGGAAKGIYHGLQSEGYHNVTIANRTIEKAEAIAGISSAITLKQAEETLETYQVVIQTTSVGMKPNTDATVIAVDNLAKNTIVSDIVYQPIITKFLQEARIREASIHMGHTMLLYQAQYAFEIWTKKQPNTTGIEIALQKELEG